MGKHGNPYMYTPAMKFDLYVHFVWANVQIYKINDGVFNRHLGTMSPADEFHFHQLNTFFFINNAVNHQLMRGKLCDDIQ